MRTVLVVRFGGKTAVVTGGANGIGRELAVGLAREGARTYVLDMDETQFDALKDEERISVIAADFASQSGAEVAATLMREAGCPDLIVNNVGVMTPGSALEIAPDAFEEVLRVNLTTPFFFTQNLVRRLRDEGRRGSVVFVSSLHARRVRGAPHYSASKAAVEMVAREFARDLAPVGIRVNVVRPGWIDTSPGSIDSDASAVAQKLIPMNRVGKPADTVGLTLALLDDKTSEYVTGAFIDVDGGLGLYSWAQRQSAFRPGDERAPAR